MSLPLREVTTPFKGRGPFRNYGPFANKGPFGRNADYSFWNRRMFWNKAAYDAAPGGRKTLMSVALMAALGYNFATSTSNAPGTVIGSDGTVQYGAHNLLAYSADFSQWSLNNSVTLNGAGSPISYNGASIATSQFVSNGTNNGPYKTFSVTPASGQAFTVFAFIRRVSGSGSVKIGSDAGTFAPVTLDPGTGGLSGGNATASGSLAVGNAWLVWATYASAGTAPNAVVYGAAASTAFEAAVAGVYGSKVLDYVATTSAAVYGPRIPFDRGATSQLLTYPEDFSQAAWVATQNGTGTCTKTPNYSVAPDGTQTACRVVATKGNSSGYLIQTVTGLPNPHTYAVGVWVKSNTGANQTFAVCDGNASAAYATATPSWTFVQNAGAAAATAGGILIGAFGAGSDASIDISIWHPQQNASPVATAYLRTTATAPLYAAGTPKSQNLANGSGTQSITVVPGCVYSVLHQSGGTYTLSGAGSGTTTAGTTTTVVATTATLTLTASSTPTLLQVWEGRGTMAYVAGPYSLYYQRSIIRESAATRETLQPRDLTQAAWTKSGSMTAAKTATDEGGVANACSTLTSSGTNQTCLQSVTSASANRAFSPKIRARSAASLTIDLTCDGGTTWVATTVNAAWMKWPITQASVTNPSYGFRLRANGDSVDVDEAQGEQGAFATSFIWGTESAAQTRSIDQDTSTIVPGNAGTWCVSFTPQIPTSSTAQTILKRGAAHLYVQSGSVKATDGTNTITIGTANAGILNTVALSWTGSTLAGSLNGAAAVTGSFTGTFGSGSTVSVGSDTTSTPLNGQIASWLSGNTAASTAQLALASAGLLA